LIGAAEKAGAKVVVYAPLSSETVNLGVNIFTKRNLVPAKNRHASTRVSHKAAQDLDPLSRREAGGSRNGEPVKKKRNAGELSGSGGNHRPYKNASSLVAGV